MARENQGLQIALIVFVMLTIILGVTTYLFFRQYEEADLKATKNAADLTKATNLAVANENDVKELKRLIFGAENAEKVDAITSGTFAEDIKKYGLAYPEDVRYYHPLLEKMAKTIDDKNKDVAEAQAKVAKLEANFAVREANKQPQLDDFQKAAERANEDLTSERSKFQSDRDRIAQNEAKLKTDLDGARKDLNIKLDSADKTLQEVKTRYQKLRDINKKLTDQQQVLIATKFDVPAGEIVWANQRTGTVWINLGRADTLKRQITFGVYPSNAIDMSLAKKASIEVTRILGDHLAEAHVFDDMLVDPVMPGDKIFTPVWTPGEKRHFALAGFMELNQSGKNDMMTVIDLITLNGGVVDCYSDDKGKRHGEITVSTRYLVKGQAPREKGRPALRDAFENMLDEAERFGVQEIHLSDLLMRMGWKNQTPVVQYGLDMNPRDFAAKPEGDEALRKSTGNVSEVFQPRVPPARIPTSAY